MQLKENLTSAEQNFLSKLIDELDVYDFIDWDKSEDSIYLKGCGPVYLDQDNDTTRKFVNAFKSKVPDEFVDLFSRCLHPRSWENIACSFVDKNSRCFGGFFFNRESLTSVSIPDGVEIIPKGAFFGCGLTHVTLPPSVIRIGEYSFADCTSLSSIVIPGSVHQIGENAFQRCISLSSITIPDGITAIGEYAFGGCTSLTSITLPDSVLSLGDLSFSGCTHLQKVKLPKTLKALPRKLFANCVRLPSVTIPDSVYSVGPEVFKNCGSLTSLTLPDSISVIDDTAFKDCALKVVELGGGNKQFLDNLQRHLLKIYPNIKFPLRENFPHNTTHPVHEDAHGLFFQYCIDAIREVLDLHFLTDEDLNELLDDFTFSGIPIRVEKDPYKLYGAVDLEYYLANCIGFDVYGRYKDDIGSAADSLGTPLDQTSFYVALIMLAFPDQKFIRLTPATNPPHERFSKYLWGSNDAVEAFDKDTVAKRVAYIRDYRGANGYIIV